MSLLVGQTITRVTAANPEITPEQIAVAFSLMTGAIAMFIGLVRLGILVDFIPAPAIAGFMVRQDAEMTRHCCLAHAFFPFFFFFVIRRVQPSPSPLANGQHSLG